MKGMKTGGRQKGTKNKRSGELRGRIMDFCEAELDNYIATYHMIDEPKEKCRAYRELLAYGMAKPAQVDLNLNKDKRTFMDDVDDMLEEKE